MHKFTSTCRSLMRSEKLLRSKRTPKYHRTFLSEAYKCEEAWNKRFESPLLSKINTNDMFIDIDRKFLSDKKVSAVDIDIFANAANQKQQVEEIQDLLQRLRLTCEASNILPSTHHAVVRFFLEFDEIQSLLNVLDNRLTYGIFPDNVSYNLLMDKCIKKQDFASAAKVASLLMLQENLENPISNALALYSTHKYLENPGDWKAKEIVNNEPVEEVKIRVAYIRNPFFDDHFDLLEPSDLAGKTLAFYGRHSPGSEGRSCRLRGLVMYKKYSSARELLEQWTTEFPEDVVYEETLDLIRKDNPGIFEGDAASEEITNLRESLSQLGKMRSKQGNLGEKLEGNVKSAIEKQEGNDISEQCKNFVEWEEKRMSILKGHLAELDRQEKKKQFAEMRKQLESRERILTYFDKEEEIELQIEDILQKEQKMHGKVKKLKAVEEEYIPPQVQKRRGEV